MNKLDRETRSRILHLLCEGQSFRATARLTGASKNTIIKLWRMPAAPAPSIRTSASRTSPCKRLQLDEIWNLVYAEERQR